MIDLFLCHAAADTGAAEAIARRLECAAETRVSLQVCGADPDSSVASRWEMGGFGGGVILLLSPDSVPPFTLEAWEELIEHSTRNADPPVACVLVRECRFPPLLRRRNFFRWPADDTLASLQRWAIGLQAAVEDANFAPGALPWFQGREREIDILWKAIVERPGVAVIAGPEGSGKTCLAQHLACQAAEYFRGIAWNPFDPPASGRVLIVVDDPAEPPPVPCPHASIVVTARNLAIDGAEVVGLDAAPQAAISPPSDAEEVRLWQAMALCDRRGFAADFAAQVARAPASLAGRLIEKRLADPVSARAHRLRLGPASRKAAVAAGDCTELRTRHAEAVAGALAGWRFEPSSRRELLGEVSAALDWAIRSAWEMAFPIADRAAGLLASAGRVQQGVDLLVRVRDSADARWDDRVVAQCRDEIRRLRTGFGLPMKEAEQMSLFG